MSAFNSPARMIEFAMKDAGLLQQGDSPTTDQLTEYMDRLNDLINLWQTQGLKLWLQRDLPVTLVAGQGTYTLGPGGDINMSKPMRVVQAYTVNTSGVKRPLMMISRDEYTRLSNVQQQGAINSVFVDKQQLQLAVTFWLVPDTNAATDVAHLITQYQVDNSVTVNDAMEFPQEWFIALRWGLADDICSGQPSAIMARCQGKANAFRQALEDWDVEDASTFYTPDSRMYGNSSGFR